MSKNYYRMPNSLVRRGLRNECLKNDFEYNFIKKMNVYPFKWEFTDFFYPDPKVRKREDTNLNDSDEGLEVRAWS